MVPPWCILTLQTAIPKIAPAQHVWLCGLVSAISAARLAHRRRSERARHLSSPFFRASSTPQPHAVYPRKRRKRCVFEHGSPPVNQLASQSPTRVLKHFFQQFDHEDDRPGKSESAPRRMSLPTHFVHLDTLRTGKRRFQVATVRRHPTAAA